MKKIILFLLFCFLIISCAAKAPEPYSFYTQHYNLVIDNRFSTTEKELIIRGWKEWENKLGFTLINKIRFSDQIITLSEYEKSKFYSLAFIVPDIIDKNYLGRATWKIEQREGYIQLFIMNVLKYHSEEDYERALFATILHEIGHVLNLTHNNTNQLTVMHPAVDPTIQEVQCIDLINLCQDPNWKCNPNCILAEETKKIKIERELTCAIE